MESYHRRRVEGVLEMHSTKKEERGKQVLINQLESREKGKQRKPRKGR